MSKRKLQQNLVTLMPRARRYGRALIGETNTADDLLAKSAANVIECAPSLACMTPTGMLLPWLFIELHKILDSGKVEVDIQQFTSRSMVESVLYEQIDGGLVNLPDLQKRAYLLTALEHFKTPVTAYILNQSVGQVMEHFQQAHLHVHDYVQANHTQNHSAPT